MRDRRLRVRLRLRRQAERRSDDESAANRRRRRAGARSPGRRRLLDDQCGARRTWPAARPVGAMEPQGLQLQRRPRSHRAAAGCDRLHRCRSATDPRRRRQLLQQLRGRLVGHQQSAAGQDRGRLRGRARASARTPCSACSAFSTSPPRWVSTTTTRTSARRSPATASARAPTWCCRCSDRRPCATPPRLPVNWKGAPPAFFSDTGTQVGPDGAADRQHPLEPARRDARDRRHRARQVHLHSRRLSATAGRLVFDSDAPDAAGQRGIGRTGAHRHAGAAAPDASASAPAASESPSSGSGVGAGALIARGI